MNWLKVKYYQEQIEKYKDHLNTLGYNAHGVRIKCNQLAEFFEQQQIRGIEQVEEITEENIRTYYNYICNRPNKRNGSILNPKTIHEYMSVVESYFNMRLQYGEIEINPVSTIKIPYPKHKTDRAILSQSEIIELYTHTESLLERAILSLAYGCGLRVSEMVQCNMDDIKIKEGVLIVPRGKNNKRRVMPLSPGVIKDLDDYLNEVRIYENTKESQSFILNQRGRRMQKDTYNRILKMIIHRTANERIKNKTISIHNLRHSIASHLLEGGMPLQQVRQFLGHDQMETTEIYTHIQQRQIKKMIDDI